MPACAFERLWDTIPIVSRADTIGIVSHSRIAQSYMGCSAQKNPGFLAEARSTKHTYGSRPSLR
jgi:hypothetical protein